MHRINQYELIQERVADAVIRAVLGDDPESLDRMPIEMRPKGGEVSRCCVFYDRAVLKYRAMAMLGFGIEDEIDELTPLSAYLARALKREAPAAPVITVISDACDACVKSHYEITNACHGCVARACAANCPKNAIEFRNGKAEINWDRCVKCGICQSACPYHAIIRIPIPCEESCPTGAITKDDDGREKIDFARCVSCGKCELACPFGAVVGKSQLVDLLKRMKVGDTVAALPAPAAAGQFDGGFDELISTLKKIGFSLIAEVASGADTAADLEAKEFAARKNSERLPMTSSCCPAYFATVEKHAPELKSMISDTPSPMAITARKIKKSHPTATTVFIGPCVAKKSEAMSNPDVDLVISFTELKALAKAMNGAEPIDAEVINAASPKGRGFAVTGGVAAAVKAALPDGVEFNAVSIDGLDANGIRALKRHIGQEGSSVEFIEVMACSGGCVAGPETAAEPGKAAAIIKKLTCDGK